MSASAIETAAHAVDAAGVAVDAVEAVLEELHGELEPSSHALAEAAAICITRAQEQYEEAAKALETLRTEARLSVREGSRAQSCSAGAASHSPGPADGASALRDLMAAIKALPDILLPGCQPEEDNSMEFDHAGTERLVIEALRRHGQDPAFGRALAAVIGDAARGLQRTDTMPSEPPSAEPGVRESADLRLRRTSADAREIAYELESIAEGLLAEAPPGFQGETPEDYALRISLRTRGARLRQLFCELLTHVEDGAS